MDKKKCNSCGAAPHKCSCKNKEFTKAVVEIDNPEQITLMRRVVIPASMGDDTTVPPTIGKYHNVLLYYEANSKSYLYSSDGIPTQLVNGFTNYEEAINLPKINGVTLLGDKSAADLELADAPMVITVATGNTSWSGADTAEDVYDFFLNKGKVNIIFNGEGNYSYEIVSAAYIPEEEKMMCTLAVATIATGETAEFEGNALFGTMTLYTADKAIDVSQIELQPKLYIADFTGLDLNYNELSGLPATTYSIGMVKPGDGLEVASDGTLSISDIEQHAHFFDTVADMKAATNLVAGDYARTLGFHAINDEGGAIYKISSTGTANEMDVIAIGDLNASLINHECFNVKQLGAYGDDNHDDTTVIQYALDTVKNTGQPLYIPNGLYKITSPLHLEYGQSETPTRPSLFKLYGDGGSVIETGKGTILKGYSISSGRAVLEIVGNGNTWGARCNFEDFVIIQDSSCDSNSFCWKLGDTFHSLVSNVKMKGYNDLLLKCGTTSASWGNISLKFSSCVFKIIDSYTKGFAILPERVILQSGQPSDNLQFDSCDFGGVACIDVATAIFTNCMETITYRDTSTSNPGDLNGISVNYGSPYLVIGAKNIKFNTCYFEDFINGIEILPLYTSINNVIVDNCYFNGITNMTIGGNRVISNSAVFSRQNSNHTSYKNNILNVTNSTFRSKDSSADYGFVTAEIINDNSEYLNVSNYTNLNKDTTLITVNDTASKYRKNEKYDYTPTIFTVTNDSLTNYGNIFKFEGLADKVPFAKKFRIKKVEIFFSASNTATDFALNLKDKDDTTFVTLTGSADFTASTDKKYYCTGNLLNTNYNYPATLPNEFYVQMYSSTMSGMVGEKAKIVIQLDM